MRQKVNTIVVTLTLVVLYILCSHAAYAAPLITSVNGTFSDGQPVTIIGSGFGTNSAVGTSNIEFLGGAGGSIESGTVGQNFARTRWSNGLGFVPQKYANDYAHSGTKSLKVTVLPDTDWNGPIAYNLNSSVPQGGSIYVSYWVRPQFNGAGQWKMVRFTQTETIQDNPYEYACFNWGLGGSQTCGPMSGKVDYVTTMPDQNNVWQRQDIFITRANTGGTENGTVRLAKYTAASGLKSWSSSSSSTSDSTSSWNYVVWQNYVGNGATNSTFWFDDIFIQNGTQARVELCDSSTWSNRKNCDIQYPVTWDNISIQIKLNTASISGTAYLYVVDSSGGANSAGYALAIGGNTPSDPIPPKNLRTVGQ